jgi:hypothetical protein
VVDRIADCLPKWKAGMLSKVGRLALVKSVLEAIPLHQLMVLGVNVRALKQVDKILHDFLLVGRIDVYFLLYITNHDPSIMGATVISTGTGCVAPSSLVDWAFQISPLWRLASAYGGSRGCLQTPICHGMG